MNVACRLAVAAVCLVFGVNSSSGTGLLRTHSNLHVERTSSVEQKNQTLSALHVDAKNFFLRPPRVMVKKKKKKRKHEDGEELKSLQCGITMVADSKTSVTNYCPSECPYFVKNKNDANFCSFLCVAGEECALYDPGSPIADKEKWICRQQSVDHCDIYSINGKDECEQCQEYYHLSADGQCYYDYIWALYILLFSLVGLLAFVIYWVVDLCLRPTTNAEGLDEGERMRKRQRLHVHEVKPDGTPELWPIPQTNLLRQDVAGPGVMLHFNFQFMIIVWAFLVALGWTFLGLTVDHDLFVLGTKPFGTPLSNCALVAWGYETQQRLMKVKVYFILWVYLMSFILVILHSVRQRRIYQMMDNKDKTMKDYAAFVSGLPKIKGDGPVEEELKKAVEDATKDGTIVGVSVCWNYSQHVDLIMEAVDEEEREHDPEDQQVKEKFEERRALANPDTMMMPRRALYQMEMRIFESADAGKDPATKQTENKNLELINTLKELETSENAWVVFQTEADRMEAVNELRKTNGFDFKGNKLTLEIVDQEPGTVQWKNFDNATTMQTAVRIGKGFGCILLGLLFWTLVFYTPYAWSIVSFNYRNGQEPGPVYGLAFSMVVVMGNAIMYQICAKVADAAGFRFKDDAETCYMILYTIACTFNVLLDTVTTYIMAFEIMKGRGFRTYDGVRLEDVHEFNERFETYAMQRSLGENAFSYAFPSTFLIPFLIEPFATIILPGAIFKLIVRSHPNIIGRDAEDLLAFWPMDMGRYADIILNVVLAVIILFFPGGYTHTLFFALALSHCWIYAFDYWKVLRAIPSCTYATMQIDFSAQSMLAPCCGLILSALIFKANGQGFGFDIQGNWLALSCFVAFVTHVCLHLLIITCVVPFCFWTEHVDSNDESYESMNKRYALSWFSSNPVHCLRSRFIYEHKPSCGFCVSGREHVLEVNAEIGCFYSSKKAQEDAPPLPFPAEYTRRISKACQDYWHSGRLESDNENLPDSEEKQPDSKEKQPDSKEKQPDSKEKQPDSEEKQPDSEEKP